MSRTSISTQKPTTSPGSPKAEHSSAGSMTPTTQVSGQSATQKPNGAPSTPASTQTVAHVGETGSGVVTQPGGDGLPLGNQDEALASEDNIFDELKTTRSTSWQFELRQMERQNRILAEELQGLISLKKKRKRRKGMGQMEKDCANCHTRVTPEWRRGPSGNRDLCNSCGLRWAKQNGRVSPRKYSGQSDKSPTSPVHVSPDNHKSGHDQEAGGSTNTGQPAPEREPSRSNLPDKIDEGIEPPHPDVLPT